MKQAVGVFICIVAVSLFSVGVANAGCTQWCPCHCDYSGVYCDACCCGTDDSEGILILKKDLVSNDGIIKFPFEEFKADIGEDGIKILPRDLKPDVKNKLQQSRQ
jgi:hypothetical protein